MSNINEVKIGIDVYKINHDADMGGTQLGSINQSRGEIKMRKIGYDNFPITKRMYYKVLMHEIVHGLDFFTLFVGEHYEKDLNGHEDTIDLVSIYIIGNLRNIIENREAQYDDFVEYMKACETKSRRLALLFSAIIDLIDNNPKLIEEFLNVFE